MKIVCGDWAEAQNYFLIYSIVHGLKAVAIGRGNWLR